MKFKNLQRTMMLLSLIFAVCFLGDLPAFGQEIELTKIHTIPSMIHVGDSFQINATIVNNSPSIIYFNGGCISPLSTTFDKNVEIGQAMGCFAIFNANLKPGETATVVGPSNNNLYISTSTGTTNANVTFSYTMENKSKNAVSKSFTFDMSKSASIPEFASISIAIFALATTISVVLVSRKNHNLFKL